MKNSLLVLSFIFISLSSYSQWHVGGTLHDVNVVEWNKGSEANQLATISDWLVTLLEKYNKPLISIDEIKIKSLKIRKCLNEGINTYSDDMSTVKANKIAYICILNFEYLD